MHIEAHLNLSDYRRVKAQPPSSPAHLNTVQSAQRRIVAVVSDLLHLEHELHEISETLPVAIDQCAMEDEAVATDVPLWLRTLLEEVKSQRLGQAIDRLREAAQRTEAHQRYAFHESTRS